ncbi:MAG TPA: LysM domain-containing protein, partial [Anaerolineae bacterium]|nr:LysM domain-containing protein [Anaerolineae bacterium]
MPQKLWIAIPLGLVFVLLFSSASAVMAAPPIQTIPCAEDYTVQAGDWLSTIAEKYYGDVL